MRVAALLAHTWGGRTWDELTMREKAEGFAYLEVVQEEEVEREKRMLKALGMRVG